MCRDLIDEVREDRSLPDATGFARREHAFDESTSGFAFRAEREFAIDYCRAKCTLGRVVRGFDIMDVDEGPVLSSVFPECLTHALKSWIATAGTRQQERVDFEPDRYDVRLAGLPVNLACLITLLATFIELGTNARP